eukprot:4068317-Amphidinium_carterae.1
MTCTLTQFLRPAGTLHDKAQNKANPYKRYKPLNWETLRSQGTLNGAERQGAAVLLMLEDVTNISSNKKLRL